jgi:hypothetical protein
LTATFPLALGLGLILGAALAQNGRIPEGLVPLLAAVDVAVVLATVGTSVVIAACYGEKKASRRRVGENRRQEELKDEYADDAES